MLLILLVHAALMLLSFCYELYSNYISLTLPIIDHEEEKAWPTWKIVVIVLVSIVIVLLMIIVYIKRMKAKFIGKFLQIG